MTDDHIIELALQERDRYLNTNRIQHSIPPETIPGNSLAETNASSFISWKEFIEQEDTDSESWLIEGILRQGWLAVIGGHGKQGKTTLAMHMLNALRLGETFMSSCQPVPVIYINCEMSPHDARDLIKEVVGELENEGEKSIIINQPQIPLSLDWLEKTLSGQEKSGVCVIDSFRGAFLLGGDTENQAGTVGVLLRKLQNIARKTGWTIILIHHFRKAGKGDALDLAGSGEWLSAPDVILTWDRPHFLEPGTLKFTGRIPPIEPLSINLTRNSISFMGTVSFQESDSQRKRILDLLTDEWSTTDEIIKSLPDIPAATVRRRLKQLYTTNKIERGGKGVRDDAHKWKRIGNDLSSNKENTQEPCYSCGSLKFWETKNGTINCFICHPPPSEESVKSWIDYNDISRLEALDTGTKLEDN